MLRSFGALPTEERAKAMKGRDFIWCALNLILDEEEELARLCPACRMQAEGSCCPACGRETGGEGMEVNESFDLSRFETLQRGGEM